MPPYWILSKHHFDFTNVFYIKDITFTLNLTKVGQRVKKLQQFKKIEMADTSVVVKAKSSKPRPRPRPFKAKTEAEAWTLETKTKARTLESKANFKAKYDSQFNVNIPHAIDMTIAPFS